MLRNILTVYRRELKTYFSSPIAYIFIMLFLGLMAFVFFFFFHFFLIGDASMRMYFHTLPWFFAVFAAAIAMRLWSEEKKLGTLELLLTMPLRSSEIVLGKYLASLTILLITLLLTLTIPLTIEYVGDPDWGKILTGYIGAFLSGALLLAVGTFVSALTENQIVALMVTAVGSMLLLALGIEWIVEEINDFFGGAGVGGFLAYFSILSHTSNLFRGVLDLRDVIYFLSMTALALLLNYIAVERQKY